MNRDDESRTAMEERITPHLDVLLAVSLGMTQNGRDATKLTREAIALARQSWDESVIENNERMWLHDILHKRFFNGFVQCARPLLPMRTDKCGHGPLRIGQLTLGASSSPIQEVLTEAEPVEQRFFSNAIYDLSEVFQPIMILSYLRGFNTREIAEMASVQPHKITSLLNRGCMLIHRELVAFLMCDPFTNSQATRSAESA